MKSGYSGEIVVVRQLNHWDSLILSTNHWDSLFYPWICLWIFLRQLNFIPGIFSDFCFFVLKMQYFFDFEFFFVSNFEFKNKQKCVPKESRTCGGKKVWWCEKLRESQTKNVTQKSIGEFSLVSESKTMKSNREKNTDWSGKSRK